MLKLCIYQNHRIYTLHRVLHFSSDLINLPFKCKELPFFIWEVQSPVQDPCTFLQNLYKISHKNCQKSRFSLLSARECTAKFWHITPKVECRISRKRHFLSVKCRVSILYMRYPDIANCNIASIEFLKNSTVSYDYFIQLEFVFNFESKVLNQL